MIVYRISWELVYTDDENSQHKLCSGSKLYTLKSSAMEWDRMLKDARNLLGLKYVGCLETLITEETVE
jgi:hypothetical protein